MWLFKCFSGHNVLKMSTSRSSRLNVRAGLASKMFAMSEISLLKSDFQWAHRKIYILRCECENKHKRQTRTLTFPTFINFFIRRAKSKTNKIHKPNISDLKHMHNFALHTLRHKQLYFRNWTTNQASNSKCANERVQSRVNSRSTEREQAQHTTQTVSCQSYFLHFNFSGVTVSCGTKWRFTFEYFTVWTWILCWDHTGLTPEQPKY